MGWRPRLAAGLLGQGLFLRGRPRLKEPLITGGALLRELLDQVNDPLLAYSDGIVGTGKAFFDKVVAAGHEGVMAKHQTSRYLAGQRSSSWRKIKPELIVPCVIIGYQAGRCCVQRLCVAAVRKEGLDYVGQLTRGFTATQAVQLENRLAPWAKKAADALPSR